MPSDGKLVTEIPQLIEEHLAWEAPGMMPLYEENSTYVGYVHIKPEKNDNAKALCPVDAPTGFNRQWA